ncbi:MAG: hypothetical protein HYX69_04625 [Planctomycetia bacterium]|nr:hypothetical protein [Planctomycetia bacterium]
MKLLTFVLGAVLCSAGHIALAGEAVFDAGPQHPWNRVHRALFTRTTQDGATYDQDGLEPPFVPTSKFLTEGASHELAIQELDAFLADSADALIKDPLKRAVLQRDLWAVFAMTADGDRPRQAERRALELRLAQVMRRVALSANEIAALPDNLAAAVDASTLAGDYDPRRPERSFLPAGLFDEGGPWVVVGNRWRHDHLAAPSHAKFAKGRSAFLILLRLSEGREATKAYLQKLEDARQKRGNGEVLVGETPQIPPGTQVALVRRTLLIDSTGTVRTTPLVENVQIRVYEDLKKPDVFELVLDRRALFAGRGGGLRPVGRNETAYYALPAGVLLRPDDRSDRDPLEMPNLRPAPAVMKSCIVCHGGHGIYGFQSLFVDHFDTFPLYATSEQGQIESTLAATQHSYAWGLLMGLWETQAAK